MKTDVEILYEKFNKTNGQLIANDFWDIIDTNKTKHISYFLNDFIGMLMDKAKQHDDLFREFNQKTDLLKKIEFEMFAIHIKELFDSNHLINK